MAREKPPLRCYHFGCGHFAKVPEDWKDENKLVSFPECTPCRKREELRDKRRAVLMSNLNKHHYDGPDPYF